MLEILIVIALYRNISAKAEAKGRSGGGYGCMVVLFWLGGEVLGAIAAAVLSTAKNGGGEPNMLFVYGGALVGAIIGATIAFVIVGSLAPVTRGRYDDEYDDEYDDRPRRRDRNDRDDRDDDDDDRPRRKRDRDDRW
jgi:hypothetical protein